MTTPRSVISKVLLDFTTENEDTLKKLYKSLGEIDNKLQRMIIEIDPDKPNIKTISLDEYVDDNFDHIAQYFLFHSNFDDGFNSKSYTNMHIVPVYIHGGTLSTTKVSHRSTVFSLAVVDLDDIQSDFDDLQSELDVYDYVNNFIEKVISDYNKNVLTKHYRLTIVDHNDKYVGSHAGYVGVEQISFDFNYESFGFDTSMEFKEHLKKQINNLGSK